MKVGQLLSKTKLNIIDYLEISKVDALNLNKKVIVKQIRVYRGKINISDLKEEYNSDVDRYEILNSRDYKERYENNYLSELLLNDEKILKILIE